MLVLYTNDLTSYLEALECMQEMEPITREEKSIYFRLRQQICNNLAHVNFKLEKFKRALRYAESGVAISGTGHLTAKSHYWWGSKLFS